jgi:cell division septation protein DedD
VQLLRAKGYNAFVLTGGPGNLHRVRVGPFAERAEADRIAAQLAREEGLKSSLIR